MRILKITFVFSFLVFISTNSAFADEASIARGRYLSVVAGCNDCHTAGFAQSGGKVPEKDWLLGVPVGWKGEWGTTYSINLRKLVHALDKDSWIAFCRNSQARPPMPAYMLHQMKDEDLISIFDFMKSLGNGGEMMPTALPPGKEPKTPYFDMTPKNLPVAGK